MSVLYNITLIHLPVPLFRNHLRDWPEIKVLDNKQKNLPKNYLKLSKIAPLLYKKQSNGLKLGFPNGLRFDFKSKFIMNWQQRHFLANSKFLAGKPWKCWPLFPTFFQQCFKSESLIIMIWYIKIFLSTGLKIE